MKSNAFRKLKKSPSASIVNIHEARAHFSKLLARVRRGEEIIIANADEPVAKLVPVEAGIAKRFPGSAKGKIVIHDDFFAPLPDFPEKPPLVRP